MKKVLILVLIASCFQIVSFVNRQIETYNNTRLAVEQARQGEIDVQNGMPVEFCD